VGDLDDQPSPQLLYALAALAPGTGLREGLDRILQAGKGALIVVGDGPAVLEICSGGFLLDAEFTPQRLAELAKMDGAIVLAPDASRIARANVHLVPDPSLPTSETGTRHRTAERVARCVDLPVVSVSEAMNVITLYRGEHKHQLKPIPALLARVNQALQTLERYRARLDVVAANLSGLEMEDHVATRDVIAVLQRLEMVRRIAAEVAGQVTELGIDGRLAGLQLEELMAGVPDDRTAVLLDYIEDDGSWDVEHAVASLSLLPADTLLDAAAVARAIHLPGGADALDAPVSARGHRMLRRIPSIPDPVALRLIDRFGTLHTLRKASIEELCTVDGVGEQRARAIRDGLRHMAQSSDLEVL
jgi:diadenylate cyclase